MPEVRLQSAIIGQVSYKKAVLLLNFKTECFKIIIKAKLFAKKR